MTTELGCRPDLLRDYIDGETSSADSNWLESHIGQCEACRATLEQLGAGNADWRQFGRLLSRDEFDSAPDIASDSQPSAEGQDSGRDDCDVAESAMLVREIQGWLDASDEPSSMGRFAGYEIVGIVGHGGMGIVLKAFERSLNRLVAIKVLAPRLATNAAARKRFEREAQAAAAVIHENVVAIHRVDLWQGLPFLVMPYLAGESLQQRLDRQGPLGIQAVLRIGKQIAEGLAAAHAQGLVHRDIKPANILLEPGVDRVQITDFGLARAVDDASITRTGIIAGTPHYMSPEQVRIEPLDGRSDLFSLGSVLYAMLVGCPPFRGEIGRELLDRIVSKPPRRLTSIDPRIPVWLEDLTMWLHRKELQQRPKSAGEVADILGRCLLHLQSPATPLPSLPSSQELFAQSASKEIRPAASKPHRRFVWGLASVVIVGLLSVALMWTPGANKSDSPVESSEPVENSQSAISPNQPASAIAIENIDQELDAVEGELNALESLTKPLGDYP